MDDRRHTGLTRTPRRGVPTRVRDSKDVCNLTLADLSAVALAKEEASA